jgi:hypothetical protein
MDPSQERLRAAAVLRSAIEEVALETNDVRLEGIATNAGLGLTFCDLFEEAGRQDFRVEDLEFGTLIEIGRCIKATARAMAHRLPSTKHIETLAYRTYSLHRDLNGRYIK